MADKTVLTDSEIDGYFSPMVDGSSSSAKDARRRIRAALETDGGKVHRVVVVPGKIIVTTDAPNGLSVLNRLFEMVKCQGAI